MTDAELSSLEAAARAATPGPWKQGKALLKNGSWVFGPATDQKSICEAGYARDETSNEKNAAYIAAANPAAILELIAELRQARKERDWIISKMEFMPCYRGRCPYPPEKEREVCMKTNKLQCWKDAAEKEAANAPRKKTGRAAGI